jgi:hypothetical protein
MFYKYSNSHETSEETYITCHKNVINGKKEKKQVNIRWQKANKEWKRKASGGEGR